MKLLFMVMVGVLISGHGFSDPVDIELADISLDVSGEWKVINKEVFPDAPANVCFPRLEKENMARMEAVIWRDADTLDNALEQYLLRIPQFLRENETFKEISRESFKAVSGIEGIRYVFQTTRNTDCGLRSSEFVRFIFRNRSGKIICLGGYGDVKEIDQIVTSSLKTK